MCVRRFGYDRFPPERLTNNAMHESTGGLPTLLKHHLPVPRDGERSGV